MKSFLSVATVFALLFLIGCQNDSGYNDGKQKDEISALTDSTSVTGFTGDKVKLVKTAAINFKVKDVTKSVRTVSALAQKFGGMIFNENLQTTEDARKELRFSPDSTLAITTNTTRADITARIPQQHLQQFMDSVADLGYFTGMRTMHIDDKSLVYLQNALKQKNRTEVLTQRVNSTATVAATVKKIEIKDEAIEQQIANRSIDAEVNYSTVDLSLFENAVVKKEMIANYTLSGYELSFGKKLSNSLQLGWTFFLDLIVTLAHLWIFILLGFATYVGYRYVQQKRKLFGAPIK